MEGTGKFLLYIHNSTSISKYNSIQVKPIGSSFIGTSPEFELALYTILYFCSSESHTDVKIAGQDVVLICFKMGRSALGTCHPMLPKDSH